MLSCICRLFNEGWKPALGWVCVAAIAWRYVGVTMVETAFRVYGTELAILRSDSNHIFALVAALLGMGGLHSYDKRRAAKDATGNTMTTQIVHKLKGVE